MSLLTIEWRRNLRGLAGVVLALLLVAACNGEVKEPPDPTPPPDASKGRAELNAGSVEPQETSGAPYPPAGPSDYVPNVDDEEDWPPVPDGPRVGDMQPANPPIKVEEAEIDTNDDKPQR